MQIRSKTGVRSYNKNYVKRNKTIVPLNFDLASLDMLCNYVISENRTIRRAQYINLKNVVEMLDMDKYVNDEEKYKRIIFIQRGLEARLDKNIQNRDMIIKYINGGLLDGNLIDTSAYKPISNSELEYINEMVSGAIDFAFIYEQQDYAIDLWNRFKTADYRSIGQIAQEIEQHTARMNTSFRKSKAEKSTERAFSLDKDTMETAITDAWNEVTSKYRKLVTGMQGFNQLIGGGFENTRVYLLLGLTGVGKSMTLLNIAYQLKKYNKTYVCKDPTKKPCIVILTMENTVTETIQRLFQISTGEDFAKQKNPQEALSKLMTAGELYLSDSSPIDIIIKYEPNKSKDTGYLYTMVEDLEDEGYEVIALILDHAKRIRSIERNSDVRLELGDIINECKTFAMVKDIPVITNSHLNRDAARTIDESAGKSKADLTRMLGKSNVGESLLMLDNVDFACIVNPEYDREGHKWMVFREIKARVKIMREYICQPFDIENEIKLIEDFYSPLPVFRETMYEDPVMNNGASTVASIQQKPAPTPYMQPKNERYMQIPVPTEAEDDNMYIFAVKNMIREVVIDGYTIPKTRPFIIDTDNKINIDHIKKI